MSKDPTPAPTASSEAALVAARAAKADAVRARGENPFANDQREDDLVDLGALRARFDGALDPGGKHDAAKVEAIAAGASVHVVGRVVAARAFGKASFLRLRDRTGEVQLFCRADGLGEGFARLDELEVADHVEAEGVPMVTRTGELSLDVRRVRLLTKAMRPLPEKWHGLTDVELRYRQRYVDLVANPDVGAVFRARSTIVSALRAHLDGLGFLEVETPSMHTLVGGAAARPFETHHNALDMRLFMRIAPELYLKRLVVGGFDRVYEIGRCYRNEGISTRHNPEFTMLEFYRAYATYETLMEMTEAMLRAVDARLAEAMPREHAAWRAARPFSFDEPFVRLSMADAVAHGAKVAAIADWPLESESEGGRWPLVDLLARDDFGPRMKEWSKSSPRAKAIDWGNFRKGFQKCENDGERLFSCYEYLVEPFLADDFRSADGARSLPVFVLDYPYETSPLARRNDARPHLVDRFELFVHGRELCNAFSELNDPADQAERFRAQVEKKAKGDAETMDFDEDYVRALEHGMPPTAGFGMGIDRLVMMLACQPSIRDVILFPLLRPENS